MAKEGREQLTHREQRFVYEYISSKGNAHAAAKAAGYSPKNVAIGPALARRPKIAAAIASLRDAVLAPKAVNAKRTLLEIARVAFSSMGDYASWDSTTLTLKSSTELTNDQLAAISEITYTPGENGSTIKLKLHGKVDALRDMAKIYGMFEKDNTQQQPKELHVHWHNGDGN